MVFTLLLLCLLHSFSFISANMKGDIRVGEHFEKELQQAYMKAQRLVIARQEITTQVQQPTQESQKVNVDV